MIAVGTLQAVMFLPAMANVQGNSVIGEVLSFSDSESLATPVTAIVEFPKVGRRMYDTGVIVSVEQSGSRYARSDDDYLPDYSDEWVPED